MQLDDTPMPLLLRARRGRDDHRPARADAADPRRARAADRHVVPLRAGRERSRAARPSPPHRRVLRARGRGRASLGPEQQTVRATSGTFAAAPPDVVHTFRNASDATAVFLNIHAPSKGFGDVVRGHGEAGFDQHDPPPDGGRPFEEAVSSTPADAATLESEARTHRVLVRPSPADRDRHDLPPGLRGRRPAHALRPRGLLLRARRRGRVPGRRRAARRRAGHVRRGRAGLRPRVRSSRTTSRSGPQPPRYLPAGFLERLRANG